MRLQRAFGKWHRKNSLKERSGKVKRRGLRTEIGKRLNGLKNKKTKNPKQL